MTARNDLCLDVVFLSAMIFLRAENPAPAHRASSSVQYPALCMLSRRRPNPPGEADCLEKCLMSWTTSRVRGHLSFDRRIVACPALSDGAPPVQASMRTLRALVFAASAKVS